MLRLILNNDKHAAEFALLSLISRVHKREGAMLLGELNINLSGVAPEQAQLLREFLCAICPLVCNFTATIDSLSNVKFTPKKNYDTNLMEEGLMGTLVNGTLVLFDETHLNPGKIDNFGVENIKSFANLIEN